MVKDLKSRSLTRASSFGGINLLEVHFYSCTNLELNRDATFAGWYFIVPLRLYASATPYAYDPLPEGTHKASLNRPVIPVYFVAENRWRICHIYRVKMLGVLVMSLIVADVGGTNARFAASVQGDSSLRHITHLSCADFDGRHGESPRKLIGYSGIYHRQLL